MWKYKSPNILRSSSRCFHSRFTRHCIVLHLLFTKFFITEVSNKNCDVRFGTHKRRKCAERCEYDVSQKTKKNKKTKYESMEVEVLSLNCLFTGVESVDVNLIFSLLRLIKFFSPQNMSELLVVYLGGRPRFFFGVVKRTFKSREFSAKKGSQLSPF